MWPTLKDIESDNCSVEPQQEMPIWKEEAGGLVVLYNFSQDSVHMTLMKQKFRFKSCIY